VSKTPFCTRSLLAPTLFRIQQTVCGLTNYFTLVDVSLALDVTIKATIFEKLML